MPRTLLTVLFLFQSLAITFWPVPSTPLAHLDNHRYRQPKLNPRRRLFGVNHLSTAMSLRTIALSRHLSIPRHRRNALRLLRPNHTAPATSKITPLATHLQSQILFSGPLTVADYMRNALTHPAHGYYTTNPSVFGASGDFVTSPQISSVFSELLAVCIAHYLVQRSIPTFRLVEIGPGCAALQRALLPALARLNHRPVSLSLVDSSGAMRERQRAALDTISQDSKPANVTWYSSVDEVLASLDEQDDTHKENEEGTPIPTMFIAHEFLDALPVHVFQRTASEARQPHGAFSAWRELLVDIDPTKQHEHALRLVMSRVPTPASALLPLLRPAPTSSENIVEISPGAQAITRRLADRASHDGGMSLLIDYGSDERPGRMTARAIAKHAQAHLLTLPGNVDVTADVDFSALRHCVEVVDNVAFKGAVSQREFLLRLGIAQRMRVLARNIVVNSQSDDVDVEGRLDALQRDYDRLVGEGLNDMGNVYKVAAICPRGVDSLAGFE